MQAENKIVEQTNDKQLYRHTNKSESLKANNDQWNPTRITYISSKTITSPKNQINGDQRQKVNVSGLGMSGYNSPKFSTYTK